MEDRARLVDLSQNFQSLLIPFLEKLCSVEKLCSLCARTSWTDADRSTCVLNWRLIGLTPTSVNRVAGLKIDDASQKLLDVTGQELVDEKKLAYECLKE